MGNVLLDEHLPHIAQMQEIFNLLANAINERVQFLNLRIAESQDADLSFPISKAEYAALISLGEKMLGYMPGFEERRWQFYTHELYTNLFVDEDGTDHYDQPT